MYTLPTKSTVFLPTKIHVLMNFPVYVLYKAKNIHAEEHYYGCASNRTIYDI